ncbi:MAG: plastocyanin/azurin family copper-binding protein [Chloroflexota bacterium]
MKTFAALLALLFASVALVACGGSSSNNSSTTATTEAEETSGAATGGESSESANGGTGSTLELEADPNGQIAYTTTEATAKAGKVTIDFNNPQSLPHDVKIESSSGEEIGGTETVADGSISATVDLKPGTYHYYCSVPGHRDAGMEGTLVVK